MGREDLRQKFNDVFTLEDQAQRSTMLNEMRSEVENIYNEVDTLRKQNEELVEKNTSLTEANSKLFMQIGYEKSKDSKPNTRKQEIDLKRLGI